LKRKGFIDEKKFIEKVDMDTSDMGMISLVYDETKSKLEIGVLQTSESFFVGWISSKSKKAKVIIFYIEDIRWI
jgi:hypothetical protein